MFIKQSVADVRVNEDENLINLILNYASSSNNPPAQNLSDIDIAPRIPEVIDEAFIPRGIVKPHHSGRPANSGDTPMEFRVAAGLLTRMDTIKNVAETLGLNHNVVATAKNGQSVFGKENPDLRKRLDESLSLVRDKAMDRLLSSLDLLDDEKIGKANAKDISSISANMSKVMTSTLPKETQTNVHAQLIVYAPTQINESNFDIVEI